MRRLIQLTHVDGLKLVVAKNRVDSQLARFAQHVDSSLRDLKTRLEAGERIQGPFRTIWLATNIEVKKDLLAEFFRDWFNNYTIEGRMAEHYGLTNAQCRERIELGRIFHEQGVTK